MAYLNLSVDPQQVLNALSGLPHELDVPEVTIVASPPRKLRGPLPRSIISKIVSDYQAGSSTRQLAAKYDRSKGTILRILKVEGVNMRPTGKH